MNKAPTDGYVVECGVGRGVSLQELATLAKGRKVFGFDSFNGLPEDWKMSDDFTWPAGSFACDVPEIDGAEIIVGYFADTLPEWKLNHADRIALLHFDGDLYSSAVTVLTELNDQILPDTILVFDDMFLKNHSLAGKYTYWRDNEYKAFHEWQDKYNRETEMIGRGHTGQATFRVLK